MLVAASTKKRSQDTAKGLFRHHNELSEMMTIQFVIDIHGARIRSGPQLGSNRHHHPPERGESFSIRYLTICCPCQLSRLVANFYGHLVLSEASLLNPPSILHVSRIIF